MSSFAARLGLLRHPDFPGRPGPVVTPDSAAELIQHLGFADQEHSVVLSLDEQHRLLAIHEPGLGDIESVSSSPRDIVKVPLLVDARSILFAHNHPSGIATPSMADLDMNKFVFRLMLGLGMEFDGAIIVADRGRYTVQQVERAPRRRPPPPPPRYVSNAGRPGARARLGAHYGNIEGYLCRTCIVRTRGYDVDNAPVVETTSDVAALVSQYVTDHNIVMIGLDAHLRVIAVHETEADDDAARKIAQVALAAVCRECVVAQRMTSGQHDSLRIHEMDDALSLVGVPLRDYIFCTADGEHASALATNRINQPDVSYVLPYEEQVDGAVAYEPVM